MTNLRLDPVQVMRSFGCHLGTEDHYTECATHPFETVRWDEYTRYAICSLVYLAEELLALGWEAPPLLYTPSGHSLVSEQDIPGNRTLEHCECGYVGSYNHRTNNNEPFITHALHTGLL